MLKNGKYENLVKYIKNLDNVAVAFSGGTDSTLLLYVAKKVLGKKVTALTVVTPYIAQWEIEEAREFTKQHNIHHEFIELPIPSILTGNPPDRCYLCKHLLFKQLLAKCQQMNIDHLVEGTNADDLGDYRPGLKALKELNIASPLLENELTKTEIRELSNGFGLPTWDKPAYACLLTRLPFNTQVNSKDLQKIEKSEKYLMDLGLKANRVRMHGDLARIEVPRNKMTVLLDKAQQINDTFKEIGFQYITVDIMGYRMGSFNQTIIKDDK